MSVLAPNDKLKAGQRYTFQFTLNDTISPLDSTLSRQLNLAYSFVENAQVSRPLFGDRVTVTLTWRGPAITVAVAANTMVEVWASLASLTFNTASDGQVETASLPCDDPRRGPVGTALCEAGETASEAGKSLGLPNLGNVFYVAVGLVALIVIALVVIAFSPAGRAAPRLAARI